MMTGYAFPYLTVLILVIISFINSFASANMLEYSVSDKYSVLNNNSSRKRVSLRSFGAMLYYE